MRPVNDLPFQHSRAFRLRRFANWFPMGLTYALLYMGRYNLTVAKNALGDLMTKEDFGIIFGAGTVTYALAFLINGPLVDRIGGRRGMLIAAAGAALANVALGAYLAFVLGTDDPAREPLRPVFSLLYSVNMYFQAYGAVSIVKVNAHWFHVRERGGFSGIFGTMISSGIFLAFTVNGWVLDLVAANFPGQRLEWVVFVLPGALLAVFFFVELFLLRDRPGLAGHADFDTGDASSGDDSAAPLPTLVVFRRIFTNPVILTVAFIELCTGVLRNGVMHWFPIYAKEVWALPGDHLLRDGSWEHLWIVGVCFAAAAVSAVLAARSRGSRRGWLAVLAGLAFLAPFVQAGWGGLLFVAGVIGGNVAGWVSDLLFQSRRAPTAALLYGLLVLASVAMVFALARPATEVEDAAPDSGLLPGDRLLGIAGREVDGWSAVRDAVACWPAACERSRWDAGACTCSTAAGLPEGDPAAGSGGIPALVERGGARLALELPDPAPLQRAGDRRRLAARPVLPISPLWLGLIAFLMSLCVIGTHGLLSGTATMDFGGRKGAATAVGVIDGFVYLGTAIQSVSLGYITSVDWKYWPLFLVPFGVLGFFLLTRIWNAMPAGRGRGH
jgi:OPA family glycerol-3-phosphate transporter-like MFS transporter